MIASLFSCRNEINKDKLKELKESLNVEEYPDEEEEYPDEEGYTEEGDNKEIDEQVEEESSVESLVLKSNDFVDIESSIINMAITISNSKSGNYFFCVKFLVRKRYNELMVKNAAMPEIERRIKSLDQLSLGIVTNSDSTYYYNAKLSCDEAIKNLDNMDNVQEKKIDRLNQEHKKNKEQFLKRKL